jgi:hypothetical protein
VTINKRQFEQHVFEPNSSFEILVRGHLWIEFLMNRVLEVHIVDASALDLDRMSFRQKIDVAQVFGFIHSEDGKAFRRLNRLRNELAHNVMAQPTESEIASLVDMIAGTAKTAFDAMMVVPEVIRQCEESTLTPLRYWFFSYAMQLDYLSALRQYERENETKIIQVEAVRYASEKYSGEPITVEAARRQFGLSDPPSPDDVWC